mmetsp:Transcript_9539/g.14351  ORF Transcript_9539/g.14351 Transcript_9539/m.14351 type:complete len:222 (-) Transcript_9539:189-854(-)
MSIISLESVGMSLTVGQKPYNFEHYCSTSDYDPHNISETSSEDLSTSSDIELENPYWFLQMLLSSRGFTFSPRSGVTSQYRMSPTQEQRHSYDTKLLIAVRNSDVHMLSELKRSGYSMSACNEHCESILHLACKRSSLETVTFLLENGAVIMADDCGRTPLHDLCWRGVPNFEIARLLLRIDPRLMFISEKFGATPLEYLPNYVWEQWNNFLMNEWLTYWH